MRTVERHDTQGISPEQAAVIKQRITLSPEEAAWILGYGITQTYRLLRSGEIPSFRNGRFWRVRRVDVDRFIEKRLAENV